MSIADQDKRSAELKAFVLAIQDAVFDQQCYGAGFIEVSALGVRHVPIGEWRSNNDQEAQ